MSRYKTATGIEAEYELGSRGLVLRNKLGIRSKIAIDQAEAEALARVQSRYFTEEMITADTRFTADLIKQMHREWLGGIYEWAGSYRTVDVAKGGFAFPPAYLIPENMRTFEKNILSELTPCRPDEPGRVCVAVARVHAELLLIHPFREGNGRLARWLANIMFAQSGLSIPDYGFTGRGAKLRRSRYLNAVIKAYYQDYSDLARFLEEALERGAASDLIFESDRGDAPSNTDDS